MSACCLQGFEWNGTPSGRETIVAGLDTYVAGSNEKVAILVIHDLYGWKFKNLRLLADYYAKDANATVYLPDFFGGEVLNADILDDYPNWEKLDLPAFLERNSKAIREPQINKAAKALRADHEAVGAIGFCWGGWAAFRLGCKANNVSQSKRLVDCISVAHPSLLTKEEIVDVAVPTQILAPEFDPTFTPELREFSIETIPKAGLAFDYQYFPGLRHGFAARGEMGDDKQRRGLHRARVAVSGWMTQWLHIN